MAAMDSDDDLSSCNICLCTLVDPVTASGECGQHNFCLTCLRDWIKSKPSAACPSCRRPISNDPDNLRVNITLRDIIAAQSKPSRESSRSETSKTAHEHALACQLRMGRVCSICRRRTPDGTPVYCCISCDYDECPQCFVHSGSTSAVECKAKERCDQDKCAFSHPAKWCPRCFRWHDVCSRHAHRLKHSICSAVWPYSGQRNFCDGCRQSITAGRSLYHCATCKYDECAECFAVRGSARENDCPTGTACDTLQCGLSHLSGWCAACSRWHGQCS